MTQGRERRESGRVELELPVEYDRLNAFLSDYTHNISVGGTFIRTERPLGLGQELRFEIRAPQLGNPLHLRGRVRWVVSAAEASADIPAGMGIVFLYDSPEQKTDIEQRLDALMLRALGPSAYSKLRGRVPPTAEG